MAFCSECGSKLADESQFCPKCGKAVPTSAEPEVRPAEATPSDISSVINAFDSSYEGTKSKNVWACNNIPNDALDYAKRSYAPVLSNEEKPLVLLNKKRPFAFSARAFLLTDRNLFYSVVKNNFFASFKILPQKGAIPFATIREMKIGEHDKAYGTAYVGHELIVNGNCIGLVRMGTGIVFDEHAIEYLNSLFANIFEAI